MQADGPAPACSAAELRALEADGWLVLRGAVPCAMVAAARRRVNASLGADGLRNDSPSRTSSGNPRVRGAFDELGRTGAVLDLLRATAVLPALEAALGGRIKPVTAAQIRLCFPADPSEVVDIDMGVANSAIPHNGWNGHVDGFWNKVYGQNNAGTTLERKELGAGASAPAEADLVAWAKANAPAPGEGLSDFSALVGVPLSAQRLPDAGNLGLLRGGHKMVEAGFRAQRAAGGPLGPGGPGWDRFNANGGLELYPPAVRELAVKTGAGAAAARVGADVGRLWPRPTQLLLDEGDAVIVHWATPHAAVRNLSADTRYMVYFRVSAEAHVPGEAATLCDVWRHWHGVRGACGLPAPRL